MVPLEQLELLVQLEQLVRKDRWGNRVLLDRRELQDLKDCKDQLVKLEQRVTRACLELQVQLELLDCWETAVSKAPKDSQDNRARKEPLERQDNQEQKVL